LCVQLSPLWLMRAALCIHIFIVCALIFSDAIHVRHLKGHRQSQQNHQNTKHKSHSNTHRNSHSDSHIHSSRVHGDGDGDDGDDGMGTVLQQISDQEKTILEALNKLNSDSDPDYQNILLLEQKAKGEITELESLTKVNHILSENPKFQFDIGNAIKNSDSESESDDENESETSAPAADAVQQISHTVDTSGKTNTNQDKTDSSSSSSSSSGTEDEDEDEDNSGREKNPKDEEEKEEEDTDEAPVEEELERKEDQGIVTPENRAPVPSVETINDFEKDIGSGGETMNDADRDGMAIQAENTHTSSSLDTSAIERSSSTTRNKIKLKHKKEIKENKERNIKKDPPGLYPTTDHIPLQQIVHDAHLPMEKQQIVTSQQEQEQEEPPSQSQSIQVQQIQEVRDARGSDDINALTLKALEEEEKRLNEQNKIHQLEAEGEGKDTLPEAINHIQAHFDQVISKINSLKPEDNLDESIEESKRLLDLYDKIKTSIHAQIDKYKEYSGENIKEDVNPSFVIAEPLSPEALKLAKMNNLHDYIVDDSKQPKPHDQTIEEIIAERDVEKKAADLLGKADVALGDLFTHDLGSPIEDLVGQEQEIAADTENPYGPFEAKIKYLPSGTPLPASPSSPPPSPNIPTEDTDGHIIPTTLDPESKQEVRITYVKTLPTKDDGMKLNGNLALGPQAVEADVAPFQTKPSKPPPAPLTVPEGLLRPIVVTHDIIYPPALKYK